MQKRIRKVLVICSAYDFYMLEEDGRIDEHIFNEYVSLNLRYPPVFIHASSAKEALTYLRDEDIDLIIEMLSIGDIDAFQLAKKLKEKYPEIPIIVLTHFSREVSIRLQNEDLSAIDYVFSWLGNPDIFLAIIKLIEDSMNAENDILRVGVQTILLVEDSVRYISSYLPFLYRIILEQSKEFVKEALNEHQQMLRRRGRPKILLATNYREAQKCYDKYKGYFLGIISDVSYKIGPNKRDTKAKAGLKFCKFVKAHDENLPFLLQSSDSANEVLANQLNIGFLNKYSKNLSNELRTFILKNFGFGEFIFLDPRTRKPAFTASDLRSFQELILSVPDDILEYHTRRDDFSKWLNARALFSIARRFKDAHYDDFTNPDDVRKYIYESISSFRENKARGVIAEFNRQNFDEYLFFSRIGQGSLGGKARGLAFMSGVLKKENLAERYPGIQISIPPTVVLSTDVFDDFMRSNDLYKQVITSLPDEKVLELFMRGDFSHKVKDDLYGIASIATKPIAIRSSSKLEDSLFQPFAGIYNTYMVPPHKDPLTTTIKIEQAIKSVYASVYFQLSRSYMTATSNLIDEEKMGIIIQSVCGTNYGRYYYPTLSGVARSLNYYPVGKEKTDDGIVNLAYGLGKTIVEGGVSLRFSPKYPRNIIQLASPAQALKETQKRFYAIDTDASHFHPATDDTVNLVHLNIKDAEKDGSFRYAASTFDLNNQLVRDGLQYEGKRIITFSNILNHGAFPLADIVKDLLSISSRALNHPVEIEFAANLDTPESDDKIFNYLQVRPIINIDRKEQLQLNTLPDEKIILRSDKAMGNGFIHGVRDFVYVKTQDFNPSNNKAIAAEIDTLNRKMEAANRQYILIGPGRWGSSDPWLGIPVKWVNISGVRVLIELGIDSYKVDPSQGTHFFHNLTSFGVGYFTIAPHIRDGIFNKYLLNNLPAEFETDFLRHVSFRSDLLISIDGRHTRGIIALPE
ncbi:MAG: response regulator [Bacteroidales bacterium]|nr:response regulator [Bacteroidales bacterium]